MGAAGGYASTYIGGGVTLAQEVDRSDGAGHLQIGIEAMTEIDAQGEPIKHFRY